MTGARTGVGIVFGAAFGLLFGLLLFDDWWIGAAIGIAAGLIIGAAADFVRPGDSRRPPRERQGAMRSDDMG